jgi:hypothetical protein
VRIEEELAHDEAPAGLEHPRELPQGGLPVGHLTEHRR